MTAWLIWKNDKILNWNTEAELRSCQTFKVDKYASRTYLKSDTHLPKKIFTCFNESPLKAMKIFIYVILKGLFILKIFKSLCWLSGHKVKIYLVSNKRLISKCITSQPEKQTITILTYCPIHHEVKTTKHWNLVS